MFHVLHNHVIVICDVTLTPNSKSPIRKQMKRKMKINQVHHLQF